MQSTNTLVSSQLHTPGAFSGSSSSCSCSPVKGILSDRRTLPRHNKRVTFNEASFRTRKRTISLTSLKWQAYIEEQFRTLRAHRKQKSKRENDCNVLQKKPQAIPRSKNRSKKQESNGSAHLSDVNMFELPKTDVRGQGELERFHLQNENNFTTSQREQATSHEGQENDASEKLVKPKRPLNAFFVFVQFCRKSHLLDSIRSSKETCQTLGRVWRHMSRDERFPFYEHAEKLRMEYYQQKGEWEKSRAQSPAARKRPLNGYTLFCREHFSMVRLKMYHAHPCLVIVRLARMWRRLRRSQKLTYKRKAKAAMRHSVPNLIAITPTYVQPKIVVDVPRDKPDYVSSEVPAEVDNDEPKADASKVSSREPAGYSDYRSVDLPGDISRTIEPPVDISRAIEPPVEISRTTEPPVDISSAIEPSIGISSAIEPNIDISSAIEPPVDISSAIEPNIDISNAIEPSVDISSAIEPTIDISNAIEPSVDISGTIDFPGDISSAIGPPGDISSAIDPHGDISSTIDPHGDISSAIDPHGDISSTIDPHEDISSTIDPHGDISSTIDPPDDTSITIDPPDDISTTIDPPGDISTTIDPPDDISDTIDPPGDISDTIDPPGDISDTVDPHGDISDTVDPHGDISDTVDGIVDVSEIVDPAASSCPKAIVRVISEKAPPEISSVGIISQDKDNDIIIGDEPSVTETNMCSEELETSEMDNDNAENETLALTEDTDSELPERKSSVTDEQDDNNSETSGEQFLGANCNNTWSDASDCDGQPSPDSHLKMDISIDDDDDGLSQSSRMTAITPSTTYNGSSVLTLTSVSRDSAVSARTLLSSCTINSDPSLAPVSSGIERPVSQSSSHPLPTCSTNQEHTTRKNPILKSRAKRLKRKPRRVRKINMERPERTKGNIDFHLSTVSEKSSSEDSSRAKPRSSMRDYLSAMSDDELPVKLMSDRKLKKYLLELKALKRKYEPTHNTSLLRSKTVLDAMSELDLYFATAEASIDSEDSLTSVLSSDSEDILYAMQGQAKSTPSDNDSSIVDDLSSNSSDSLSFCFISSHLLVSPSASANVQQVFKARAEAAIELGSMDMSATFDNNEPSSSYLLNASVKNDKRTVQILGDKSLNHTQKTSLLYSPVKEKKAHSAHCSYLRYPCQPNSPPKYPCIQLARCQTAPCSVIQDELRFSSSEAVVPKTLHLTGQVQDQEVMICSQPNPETHKQSMRSIKAERPHWSSANARRRDERRNLFTERLSPTNKSCASCPLNNKKGSLFIHRSDPQQASIVPMAEKFVSRRTQALDGVTSCREVSVSSGIKHGEGEADQNKCESWKKFFDRDILRLSAKMQLVSLSEQGDSNSDLDTIKNITSPSLQSSGAVTEEESAALESPGGSAARVTFAYSQRDSRSLRRDIRFRTVAARSDIRSRSARSHGCFEDRRPFGDDDRDICSMVMDDEGDLETPADYPSCPALGKKKKLGFGKTDILNDIASSQDRLKLKASNDLQQLRCQNTNIWALATSFDNSDGVHKYGEEM